MPMKTIRSGTGAQRLPKLSKFSHKAIDYTPTTANPSNAPSNTQVSPQEHLTWHHDYPPKDFSPILKLLFHITLLFMILAWPEI